MSEDASLLSTPGASSSSGLLTYYSSYNTEEQPVKETTPAPAVRELSKTRLYVGNLHSTLNEYALLQVFSKFGKVAKLDFLFHKSGPSKGKPRGYAFVEYQKPEEAEKALKMVHDKLLRGRKVVVTYASQAPMYDDRGYHTPGGRYRRSEPQRPTALSLIKASGNPSRTEDKIAAMEAKLRQMEKAKEPAPPPTLPPAHPSLPLKPSPSVSDLESVSAPTPTSTASAQSASTSYKSNRLSDASTSGTRVPNSRIGGNNRTGPYTKGRPVRTVTPLGIFASGSSSSLGKKPTLEELMKTRQKSTTNIGLLKR